MTVMGTALTSALLFIVTLVVKFLMFMDSVVIVDNICDDNRNFNYNGPLANGRQSFPDVFEKQKCRNPKKVTCKKV